MRRETGRARDRTERTRIRRPGRGIRGRRRRLALRRRGFALIAALALLVVLSATGAVMLRLTGSQQAGTSLAVLGLRAEWAARSGIEWGLRASSLAGGCPAPVTSFSITEGGLSGFDVEVRCSASTHVEGSQAWTSLALEADASFGSIGSREYVFRQVRVSAVL